MDVVQRNYDVVHRKPIFGFDILRKFNPTKTKTLLILKPQPIMKKLHSNLAVIKSTVIIFDNRKQPKRSTSTIICTRF
jgi:hypothetical protein